MSPSWPTSSRASSLGTPARVTATRLRRPGCSRSHSDRPAQDSGSERSMRVRRPVGSDQSRDVLVGQQAPPDLVDGPRHGGHGGDAEPLVDLGAAGVVDPGHHVGDLVGLPGDAHGQDVGVVPAGHGGQRVGVQRARLLEDVAVEPRPHDAGAVPLLEAPEGPGGPVHDGDGMALGAERDGETRAHPAAPDDDHMHATVQHAGSPLAKVGRLRTCAHLPAPARWSGSAAHSEDRTRPMIY